VLGATRTPCSRINSAASSANVMSFRASIAPSMAPRCASIRCDRVSPPFGLATPRPCSRQARTHLIAVEIATLNRSAAARRDIPPSTAAITRPRKSSPYVLAIAAGLQPSQQPESDHPRVGQYISTRFGREML
jgi:hypothetical protein